MPRRKVLTEAHLRVLGLFYLLSQVDVDRLEAKLADGTITSRLEAAIACLSAPRCMRPAGHLIQFLGLPAEA
jgi:hypothetical protein